VVVSGIGAIVEAIVGIIHSFGSGHVSSGSSENDRKKRRKQLLAEFDKKHGSKWPDKH
jgi:hypothetical protein